jgi:hypothetical protein
LRLVNTDAIEDEFVVTVVERLPIEELNDDDAAVKELFKLVTTIAAELEFVAIVELNVLIDELSDDDAAK